MEGTSKFNGAMSGPVTPANVLARLMNDGIFDQLRAKITQELKQNEELRSYTMSLVENSQALNFVGADRKKKRELFDALRKELDATSNIPSHQRAGVLTGQLTRFERFDFRTAATMLAFSWPCSINIS
ncbi:hypothetical protein CBR_g66782 [Chara braunii]|uniref:Uncharacterized protein n=1 Tax=Chara braunii TaxID=69332 RepID=A0A388K9E4_CHABU|nr:hypothetical protein CBR_g66782 [Chara braunii]|eukprot:GBG66646.1 hypothetical protein CBR_g66782 [Chara braunii]